MLTPFVQGDIGPRYDFGLETRDGTNLSCVDSKGSAQLLSKVAYMCSTQDTQHEATELQEKAKLIALSGPNLVDREFDQWPQVQQGDWSGGMWQRIFSGATPVSGGQASDPTRYWDGHGLIWPIDDTVPQQPTPGQTFYQWTTNAQSRSYFSGNAVGGLSGFAGPVAATLWKDNTSGNIILAVRNLTGARATQTLTNPFGAMFVGGMQIAGRILWTAPHASGAAGTVVPIDCTAGVALVQYTATTYNANGSWVHDLVVAEIGNKQYVAVAYHDATALQWKVWVGEFTIPTTGGVGHPPVFVGAVTLNMDAGSGNTTQEGISSMAFLGDDLYIANVLDSTKTDVIRFNIPTQTTSVVAQLTAGQVGMTQVAGGLFLIASSNNLASTFSQYADIYLLQGNSLQHISPLKFPSSFDSLSKPTSFGPYAMWVTGNPNGANKTLVVWAYDVLRGRIFKVLSLTGANFLISNLSPGGLSSPVASLGIIPPVFTSGQGNGQWGVAVTYAVDGSPSTLVLADYYFGGSAGQGWQDVTSSLIDFTSASNKLYRQLIASHDAISGTKRVTVQVWLDTDPALINFDGPDPAPPAPTVSVVNVLGGGLPTTQTPLVINKIARKLVYRVLMDNSAGQLNAAPKLTSVAIQAGTGWVHNLRALLSRTALTNGGQVDDFAYEKQGFDELAAYNFIRQLWRLKGGQCIATFPNGDRYNALIQLSDAESPKPFGVAFSSDQRTGPFEQTVSIKIREDV